MTSETTALLQRIDALTSAVCLLAQAHGSRLSKAELATRMGVHRNTLRTRLQGKDFPKAGPDGKWALADVIAWEQGRGH
jgi:transcriptional regulator with XRE-family HTH domain